MEKIKIKKIEENSGNLSVTLTFLKQTKEGKYARIDKSSLKYIRIAENPQDYVEEENYVYNIF